MKKKKDTTRPFDVAIVIPTRNAGPQFERTLRAIDGQETEKGVEVIALDSGSTDGTVDLLHRHGVRVMEIPPSEFDWGRIRDRLFREAKAPIAVNLSQDAVPERKDWLEKLTRPLEAPDVAASSGSSIPDPERDYPQFQWERNGYYCFTREMQKFFTRYGKGLSFANAAVRLSVWEQLGIDPQFTSEDFQFQTKLCGAGWRIAFPTDAPVLHHHNYTFTALFRRCRNEGLALRTLDCPYHEFDLLRDLASPRKYVQWLRELLRGSLRSPAEYLFPVLRPVAVYMGSRFGKKYVWY